MVTPATSAISRRTDGAKASIRCRKIVALRDDDVLSIGRRWGSSMQRGSKALGTLILAVALAAWTSPAPAQDAAPFTRIAFGSCAHQAKPQPIWDAVLDYRPELFIFAGDNVYGDITSGAMTELREAYAAAAAIEGYAKVRATAPVLATWDDHDYGQNDGGADFAQKAAAKRLFLDFWQVPAEDPRRTREGIYHAQTFGPAGMRVQVVLLDTRSFRSPLRSTSEPAMPGKGPYLPDADPAKTMLGAAQWAWLRTQLLQPAELRLIVSSVQVLADDHGWESWGNLPLERTKLFDLIAEAGAGGVILLSGDRHVGALYQRRAGVPYGLHEITASGINMSYAASREPGPLRLGAVYGAPNFGTVDIDWWAGEVRLSVRGMNGEPVREVTVPLADLAAP
jgi:alkaline phosphatase D